MTGCLSAKKPLIPPAAAVFAGFAVQPGKNFIGLFFPFPRNNPVLQERDEAETHSKSKC